MKRNDHHIDKLIAALEDGQGRVIAVKKADISYQTFMNWITSDIELFERIKKAEDIGNDKVKEICKRRIIENETWQSAAWWLERNYPDQYRERKNIDANIQAETKLTEQQYKELIEAAKNVDT
jgi:hypothetical protein